MGIKTDTLMLTVLFLAAVPLRTVVLAQLIASMTDNFLVVTDLTHNTIYQVSLVTDEVRAIGMDTFGSPIAIAYNHITRELMWSTQELIHQISLEKHNYIQFFETELLGCHAYRFAIDYPSGNLYYTANPISETGFVGIGVISPKSLHKRLLTAKSKPKDIVLDSEEGLMFWTNHGDDTPYVSKANMDGTDVKQIINNGLFSPNCLAIDTKENVLYTTDGTKDIVYKCSYHGDCNEHFSDSGSHLMDITLLGDYLYYTASERPYISKLSKTNPSSVIEVGYNAEFGRLDSLAIYSSMLDPSQSAACSENNGLGPCSTFCLPENTGYTCACEDKAALKSDGKTCENAPMTDNFLVVTELTRNTIYQVSLVNDEVRAIDTNTFGSPIAIAYNYITRELMWSTKELIHQLSLENHNYKIFFKTEFLGCHADRFAIDYPSGNLYYTANPTSERGFVGIGVISPKSLHKRLLTAESKPKEIVLDSDDGFPARLMFWANHGYNPPYVARANMDGSDVMPIVKNGLVWPNGLAIDTKEMEMIGGTNMSNFYISKKKQEKH